MLRGGLAAVLILAPLLGLVAPADARAPAWWETTRLDADGDRLDDALRPLLAGADPLTVLVAFDGPATPAQRRALEAAGFEVVHAFSHFDVVVVRALPPQVTRLLEVPGVVFVETNDVVRPLLKESVPLIGAPQAWESYGATGRGQVIAVLDDGTFSQHPDFDGKVAAAYDASATSSGLPLALPLSVPIVPAGADGHGTHVAGIVAGTGGQSGGSYRGVAPDARFVDVKVFSGPDQTNSDIVLRGLEWVLSNRDRLDIRVASMSLGGRPSDGTDALSRSVNVAVDKGLVVVAAAGNAGPGPSTVASPGAAEKAITVGAVDKAKRIASYSSRGPTLDGRLKPDLVAPGSAITSTVPPVSTTSVAGLVSGDRALFYGALSGTSMAAPHVSGVVALMLQVNPDLTPFEVKQILVATAQDLGPAGRDNDTGYGFVNAIAAVQVADDPRLLDSPQLAGIAATLPEPGREAFGDRVRTEYEALARSGRLPLLAGLLLALVAVVIVGVVLARRRRP